MPSERKRKQTKFFDASKNPPTKKTKNKKGGKKEPVEPEPVLEEDEYLVESILDARVNKKGVWRYKVRWVGYTAESDTWEPVEHLGDYFKGQALKLRAEKDPEFKKQQEEIFNELVAAESENEAASTASTNGEGSAGSDDQDTAVESWKDSDRAQVKFREVERINVHDENARQRVTEAREFGIPVCLTGHSGWAQFTKRWLKKPTTTEDSKPPSIVATAHVEASKPTSQAPTEDAKLPRIVNTTHVEVSKSTSQESTIDSKPPSIVNTTHVEVVEVSRSSSEETASSSASIMDAYPDNAQHGSLEAPPVSTVIATGESSHVSDTSSRHSPSPILGNDNAQEPDTDTTSDWLDLTQEWQVDVQKMSEDVGHEDIPYVKKGYNALKPLGSKPLLLSEFLKRCWPSDTTNAESDTKNVPRLYLHQWQFPLSDKGSFSKLCGDNCHRPPPNDILGEDLLAYWHDNNVNPYQYIFMGREETMSRLHKDPGGLDITITPIVGQKEISMVHRDDGISCCSNLEANLDSIDLQKFPTLPFARIFKTVVNPGEILLMPQGTYHQCRNVTPCLSYSRFHLDSVNLKGFFDSFTDGDAPEIEHEVVIWNATHALFPEIDSHVTEVRKSRKDSPAEVEPPAHIARKVEALKALRNICRAISTRYEKGLTRPESHDGLGEEGQGQQVPAEEAKRWATLLGDIDLTLHFYRYRNHQTPTFRPRGGTKSAQSAPSQSSGSSSDVAKSPLEDALATLPFVVENTNLCIGNRVEVNFHGRRVEGELKKVEMAKHMAMCQFEELPPVFDEFLPFEWLRAPVAGGSFTEIPFKAVKPGKVIVYPSGKVEYRGNVKWCTKEDFVYVCLKLGEGVVDRWLPRSSIMSVQNSTCSDFSS